MVGPAILKSNVEIESAVSSTVENVDKFENVDNFENVDKFENVDNFAQNMTEGSSQVKLWNNTKNYFHLLSSKILK